MSFLGLPMSNGDFGGETAGSSGLSPSQIADVTNFAIDDNGTAPTPSSAGSGGGFLNELGAFSGILTSGVTNIIRAGNPQPIMIPRTTNLPSSSLQRLTGASSGSSILLWVVIAIAVVIGLKFLRK